MRIRAVILTVVVASGLLSSCGGSSKSSSSSSKEPALSAQEQVLAQINDEGYLPKDAALQLFALQYGPLPGVTTPKGPPGENADGNLAITNVFRVWSELTAAQQAKVIEYLELPADFTPARLGAASISPSTTAAGGPGRSRRADTDVAPYRASADAVLPYLANHFGPLGVPLDVQSSTLRVVASDGSPALADAIVLDGQCRVRVFPRTFAPPSGPSITLAHEIFHCYQQVWNGGVLASSRAWVEEGTAEWVGMTINAEAGGPEDNAIRGNFSVWYRFPDRPLFRRAYDAVAFFTLAQQKGVDVMSRMRAVVTARSNRASFDALGAPLGESFSSDWATTERSEPSWGARWALRGPGVPTVNRTLPVRYEPVRNGATKTISSPAFASAQGTVSLQADITRFESALPSAGYMHTSTQERSLASLRDEAWCTASDVSRCRCPEGTVQAGREFPAITPGDSVIVVSAATEASSVSVRGTSLEDECGVPRPCPVGTWKMNTLPTGLPFTPTSGGTGKVLTIAADGRLVQSFAEYVTMNGEKNGAVFFVEARGQLTGRIAIPADNPRPTGMRVTDVDANGITGIERITFPDGQTMEISGPDFTAVASALADLGRTATINCAAANALTVTAGGITETYARR